MEQKSKSDDSDCYVINGGGRNLKCVKDKGREEYIIPMGVTSICKRAFKDCTSMKRVVLPNSITCIGEESFQNCFALREIVIPEGVTSIGKYCFADCRSLKEISFPESIAKIGFGSLDGCCNLLKVSFLSIRPDKLKVDNMFEKSPSSNKCTLSVPQSSYKIYNSLPVFKQFYKIIPDKSFHSVNYYIHDCFAPPLYSIADLQTRGWTYGMINEFDLKQYSKDDNGIVYYLKSSVEQIEMSDDFQFERAERRKCWRRDILVRERGWSTQLIDMLLEPYLTDFYEYYLVSDVIEAEKSEEYKNLKHYYSKNQLYARGWTLLSVKLFLPNSDIIMSNHSFYKKDYIEQIESSEEFIRINKPHAHVLCQEDLVNRNWPKSLIDQLPPDYIEGKNKYYLESCVYDFEQSDAFITSMKEIKTSCWSKSYLLNNGWSNFTIKMFAPKVIYTIDDEPYYEVEKVKTVVNSRVYKDYQLSKGNWRYLLGLLRSGDMTINEFLAELEVYIPIINPKNRLKKQACDSFMQKVLPLYSLDEDEEDRHLAQTCMDYLRHKHTDYDNIWRALKKLDYDVCDRLRMKINKEIGKNYPWIHKYANYNSDFDISFVKIVNNRLVIL